MSMPNAQPSSPIPPTSEIKFYLEVGQESLRLPQNVRPVGEVWLSDIRRRRYYLERVSKDDFAVLAFRYKMSSGEDPPHLRGMPRFYCLSQGELLLWPVPAHPWPLTVQKGEQA